MFQSKRDRMAVELGIEINLNILDQWIASNGEIEDIALSEKESDITDEIYHRRTQKFCIDILPNGQRSEIFFDRTKVAFSNSFDGYADLQDNFIEWSVWRQYIFIKINEKPVLVAPVDELVNLQYYGDLKGGFVNYGHTDQVIQVPIEFDGDVPKRFINVLRDTLLFNRGVCYRNALASIYYAIKR
jgi:hypothetical protein